MDIYIKKINSYVWFYLESKGNILFSKKPNISVTLT
jgi:hypothetical protein